MRFCKSPFIFQLKMASVIRFSNYITTEQFRQTAVASAESHGRMARSGRMERKSNSLEEAKQNIRRLA